MGPRSAATRFRLAVLIVASAAVLSGCVGYWGDPWYGHSHRYAPYGYYGGYGYYGYPYRVYVPVHPYRGYPHRHWWSWRDHGWDDHHGDDHHHGGDGGGPQYQSRPARVTARDRRAANRGGFEGPLGGARMRGGAGRGAR
jgi:hypothetical protein